jgi:hypothetical protein
MKIISLLLYLIAIVANNKLADNKLAESAANFGFKKTLRTKPVFLDLDPRIRNSTVSILLELDPAGTVSSSRI